MSTQPEAFFLPASLGRSGQRFCIFHAAQGPRPRGCILYIHPFAEEMNKSRRMAALQSRALAQAGYAVLQIDLLGCGDSSGDFGDASWQAWVDDVVRACQWLRTRCDAPLWLWGLRAGCLVAAQAARQLAEPCNFIFWAPTPVGKTVWQQFMRLKVAGDLLSGNAKGVMDGLHQQLAAGEAVEIAGYLVAPALARGEWPCLLADNRDRGRTGFAVCHGGCARRAASGPSHGGPRDGMNYTEHALQFSCEQDALLGILSLPKARPLSDTGVVVIVGGPQYRAGSHRQFVLLARALAEAGHAVLRFDYRGMGDSTGDQHSFEHVAPDIACAIDTLQRRAPSVRHVVLWGLCDGTSAALLYCSQTRDARVAGLCLLNPWVRSAVSLAKTQVKHYYTQRLQQREFWAKLFSGRVAGSALTGLARNVKTALSRKATKSPAATLPFQDRMAAAWHSFEGNMMLLLSGDDYTAKEFLEHVNSSPAWSRALLRKQLMQRMEPEADHTFSQRRFNARVAHHTLDLLGAIALESNQVTE